ncbi:secretin and TonB N-terminal domain-containing protein [Antarctobacter heliothermus]|nr:secretin and TonB N-terminal domain-containing protein [Antarctobacter heliothermus]MCA0957354.1 secretin and TonB N-terminal domain-containing protein [Mameliella alba]
MLRKLVALLAVQIAIASVIAAPIKANPLIENVFFQADLRQAIEEVSAQAGVNIIADPTVQGLVTVTIEGATVEKALDLLLAGTQYRYQRTEDYYLVYSADATSELLTDVSKTQVVTLQNISPGAARDLLAEPLRPYVRYDNVSSSRLAITAPPEILERILTDLQEIDQGNEQTIFISLKNISAEAARSLLPENLQVFVRADASRNMIALTAPKKAASVIVRQLRELDRPGPALSLNAPTPYRTKLVKLNHVPVSSLINILPEAFAGYVKADATSNSISVAAPEHVAANILSSIYRFDVPRQHVMLEARIVVMDKTDTLNFGGDVQWPTIQVGFNDTFKSGFDYELSVGYLRTPAFTKALSMSLNLLSQNDEATIVASPKVLAQDGVASEIKVTTEEYIQIDGEQDGFVRGQLEQIETGTILNITPTVGANGVLTLELDLEVSDVVSRGAQGLPVVSRRTAKSTVQLQNGGTAAVAGLVDNRTQIGSRGFPGSRKLPLLGRAFRTDSLRHDARQVAIFVTATLVDADGNRVAALRSRPKKITRVAEDLFRAELEHALIELGALQK